jgi:hypothetical protein
MLQSCGVTLTTTGVIYDHIIIFLIYLLKLSIMLLENFIVQSSLMMIIIYECYIFIVQVCYCCYWAEFLSLDENLVVHSMQLH